jgi:xanthine/CO dehydrogenase XdhC/CoxF family maturation factor
VLFDVNGTLSDLESLRELLVSVGAPGHTLDIWFTSVLRDGFALTLTGAAVPFPTVAASILRTMLAPVLTRQQPGLCWSAASYTDKWQCTTCFTDARQSRAGCVHTHLQAADSG